LASTAEDKSNDRMSAPVVARISVKRPAPEPASRIVSPFRPVGRQIITVARERKADVAVELSLTVDIPLHAERVGVVLAADEPRHVIDDWKLRAACVTSELGGGYAGERPFTTNRTLKVFYQLLFHGPGSWQPEFHRPKLGGLRLPAAAI
jgi:hypothetical protein